MGNFYPNAEVAMWAYIAGELKECPCSMSSQTYIRVLGALGGAIDPSKVSPGTTVERYMLMFAKNLAAMRAELEELRAQVKKTE